METFDVVIVGGGHNGLVAAAYLARAGCGVLVLERREVLGGACVTESPWPGYRVSTAAYLCSLLAPRIIHELDLVRHGLQIYRREASGFAPFPDGSHLLLYPDTARTQAELQRFAPGDVEAFFRFEEEIERAAAVLEPFLFAPSPSLGQVADAFTRAGIGSLFPELFEDSVRAALERRFRDERLMAVLATDGLIGTRAGVGDPGTAYVMLHHYMGRALGARGLWGYVRGGMGRISEALAASAREQGAEIRTGVPVARILTRGGRAAGVVTAEGGEIHARAVLSNADAAATWGLVDGPIPDAVEVALPSWQPEGVSCKINLAVTELPDFALLPGREPGPQHLGTVHLAPTMDFLDRAWRDCRAGRPSAEPMVEVYIQTATDPSLAPPGRHILSCFTQYYPRRPADGVDPDWERESYVRRVLEQLERQAPNVPGSIEHVQVLTPRDLEERFGLPGGHIFHGDILPERMFGERFGQRGAATVMPGLYLCGSAAWPGGCVSGIPGLNAARELLADWRAGGGPGREGAPRP